MIRGIQLDQSHGLSPPSVIGVGATFGVPVEAGHDSFYASACRSEVEALGIPYLDVIL
ncbi:hypothetical protein KY285_001039 [Solanum tuberosum]|nr:hypothetical protein KY285_001039 [Solanum tuberosum]